MRFVLKALFALLLIGSASLALAQERILALSPHACEMLSAIGAGDEVVGVSQYCNYPASLKDTPVIANYSRLFSEAAIRLQPSMIITSNAGLNGLQDFNQAGVRIVLTHPQSLDDIFSDLLRLGALTGHEQQADLLVEHMRTSLQHTRSRIRKRQRVFFEVWSDPLMTEAGRSFITQVLAAAGGDNVFADQDVESMRVNVESVVRADPEIIIIPSHSGNIEARRLYWQKWLPDVRVIVVNPDLISRPSPRVVAGITNLQKQLDAMISEAAQ